MYDEERELKHGIEDFCGRGKTNTGRPGKDSLNSYYTVKQTWKGWNEGSTELAGI